MFPRFSAKLLVFLLLAIVIFTVIVESAKSSASGTNVPIAFISSPSEYTSGKIYTYRIWVFNPDAVERQIELTVAVGEAAGGGKGGPRVDRKLALKPLESRTITIRAMARDGQYPGSWFCFEVWAQKRAQPGSSYIVTCAAPTKS